MLVVCVNTNLTKCSLADIMLLLGSGCDITRDCDDNANCQPSWDGNEEKFVCQCNSGYLGDGHTCTKKVPSFIFKYKLIFNFLY